jgi:hypothetical protein
MRIHKKKSKWAYRKFRKSQIRNLTKLARFVDLPEMWFIADLRFANPSFFVIYGLKNFRNPQIHTFSLNTNSMLCCYTNFCGVL